MKKPPYKIAAIVPIGPEYSGRLLEGMISYAREHENVAIIDCAYLRDYDDPLASVPENCDGALVWLREKDHWVNTLIERGLRVVNASGDYAHPSISNVAFKGSAVVDVAADHLASLGRSHAAFIGTNVVESPSLRWRAERFAQRCQGAGMKCEVVPLGRSGAFEDRVNHLTDKQAARLSKWLNGIGDPIAVWCEDDHLARIVCDRAMEQGLESPGQIAVLGLHDYRICLMKHPTISTVPQPGQVVAREAIRMIHLAIEQGKPMAECVPVQPPPVIVRESTSEYRLEEAVYYRIHRMIQNKACEGLGVEELVAVAGVSQRTFSKRFLEIFGRTPGAEIRRVRTEKAKSLIARPNLSIKEVAHLCGFEEPGKFCQFFKREAGMKPSDYRESLR